MNRRILVIDDQKEVLKDYEEILTPHICEVNRLRELEEELFGEKLTPPENLQPCYELYLAKQGQEGYELVKKMKSLGTPFAVAFIDMRMPGGWDGLETARRIRQIDPDIEIVIVTAYSDRDRIEIVEKVGEPSKLLYLKKPFDLEEIRQLALALTEKWNLEQKDKRQKELLKNLLVRINQIKNIGLENLDKLLEFVFEQMINLMEVENGFLCQIDCEAEKLIFRCGAGKYKSPQILESQELTKLKQEIFKRAKKPDAPCVKINGFRLIPFYVVKYEKLVLVVENPRDELLDSELIRIFVENVSGAIDTAYLYEKLYQSHRELEEANRKLTEYKQNLERKIQERTQELYHLNELHKSIIENAGIAIFTFDKEGVIKSANQTTANIFGFKPEELIGKNLEVIMPNAKKFLAKLEEREDGIFPWEKEMELKKAGGQSFPAHINISRVRFLKDEYFYLLLVSDLTERKALERQLLQSQKLESIGTLAGGVAHNFNNLLLVILNSLNEIQERLPNDPELEFNLELIRKSAEQASELTQQLLSFSRKKSPKKEPVNVKDLINDVVKLLEKTIHKNISIEVAVEENLPPILGDSALLQQALLNLGLNARDAMPHGGILSFEARKVKIKKPIGALSPGEYLQLIVEDTGIGIPPEIKERIFEPFFTTKGLEKGTGLGLPTVYGIVKNHQGEIEVESELGQGTKFIIYLPIAKQEELKKFEEKPKSPAKVQGGGKILLIDDEEALLRLAEIRLSKLGYEVLIARGGEEALELIKNHPDIRAVAMDMIMPGLSGKSLFSEIKKLRPNLPVLIISGYSYEGDAEELIKEGAIGYLQKPFIFDELINIVERGIAQNPPNYSKLH